MSAAPGSANCGASNMRTKLVVDPPDRPTNLWVLRCAQALGCPSAAVPLIVLFVAVVPQWPLSYRKVGTRRRVTVDYTLSATDENKQFIAGGIKHEGSAGWESRVDEVVHPAANAGLKLPPFGYSCGGVMTRRQCFTLR